MARYITLAKFDGVFKHKLEALHTYVGAALGASGGRAVEVAITLGEYGVVVVADFDDAEHAAAFDRELGDFVDGPTTTLLKVDYAAVDVAVAAVSGAVPRPAVGR